MTVDPDRGRVPLPDLDDRTWAQLVDEMRALIPQYAPAWTDQNPSDLGITLIELFAWLAEGIIYRLNRVPEKHYLAFVRLLGITREPATPARTHLTFTAGVPVDVPAGTQAQTTAVTGETPIVFETDEAVRVLPVNLASAVVVTAAPGGAPGYADATRALVGPPAEKHELEVPAKGSAQLCLGFDELPAEEIRVGLRLYQPAPDVPELTATWVYAKGAAQPADWPVVGDLVDGSAGLRHDGAVRFAAPADWARQRPTAPPPGAPAPEHPDAPVWSVAPTGPAATDARFWVGVRFANTSAAPIAVGVERVLFNAAVAHTALTVRTVEDVGTSTGAPFQTFALAHRPVHRAPDSAAPYAHLVVQVGANDAPAWTRFEDAPPGTDEVYWLDPVTGEIRFGDKDRTHPDGHGAVPPAGAVVRARYRWVAAGAAGNVAAGRVTVVGPTPAGLRPDGVTNVTNLGPGRDGADEEPVEETLRRAPEQLTIRDRAVTADDYEFLAGQAPGKIAICRCLTPRLQASRNPADAWAFGGLDRSPGVVTVLIVPDQGLAVPQPVPTPDLLRTVKAHLDERRDLTVHLEVEGPRYLPVVVTASLKLWQSAASAGFTEERLEDETEARIARFLHPTAGGLAGTGWRIGQPVFSSDVFRAIMPTPDVGYVESIQVAAGEPVYEGERPPQVATAGVSVPLADYELVCAGPPVLTVEVVA